MQKKVAIFTDFHKGCKKVMRRGGGLRSFWLYTGCSVKIVLFPQNVVIFLNFASSVAINLPSSSPA